MKAKNLLLGLGACVLVVGATATIGYGSQGFKNWNLEKWFQNDSDEEKEEEITEDNGVIVDGEVMTSKYAYMDSLPNNMIFRSLATNQSVSITATVLPETTFNKNLSWSVAYKDGSSGATDKIKLTISSDTHTCTVNQTDSFTKQIILTVATTDGSNLSKTCTLDYLGRTVTPNTTTANATGYINDAKGSVVLAPFNLESTVVSGGSINGTFSINNIIFGADFGYGFEEDSYGLNQSFYDIGYGATNWGNAIDYGQGSTDIYFNISYNLNYNGSVYSTGKFKVYLHATSANFADILLATSLSISNGDVQF